MKRKQPLLAMTIMLLALIPAAGLAGCRSATAPPAAGLQLEEHPLEAPPDADSGVFLPAGTSQEAVLERHRDQRERAVSNPVFSDENYQPVMTSRGDGEALSAVLRTSTIDPPSQIVDLMRGEEVIFTADAGLPSPAVPQQSLWTFNDHWALEILLAEEEIWQGQLFQDGQLVNELNNYQEVFGFQLLAGEPFFFYQRDGKLGYSYTGQETTLPYDHIPHYECCSASTLNPRPAENMVAFYAQTGEDWYYVELGAFSQD